MYERNETAPPEVKDVNVGDVVVVSTCKVRFCPKLPGDYNFEAVLVLCCLKLLRDYNFEAALLCQAVWEVQVAGSWFCIKLLGNSNLQGPVLPQAIGG